MYRSKRTESLGILLQRFVDRKTRKGCEMLIRSSSDIYLIEMADMLRASSTHLISCLPIPLAFRCLRQSRTSLQEVLVHLFSLTECCKDGKIILCDKDVSKGNQVEKVDKSLLRSHS
jgi:hypothetical protein